MINFHYVKPSRIFKGIVILIIFIIPVCYVDECSAQDNEISIGKGTGIKDLVLIYHGSTHRPDWNVNELRPYIYKSDESGFQWLFDGFLFLEIFDKIKRYEWDPGFGYNTASKKEWEWLLDRYFGTGKGPDALELILDSLSKKGEVPLRPRRIVISIPCPVSGFNGWGEINGKKIDFNKSEDQVEVACWFADRVMKRWKEKSYRHIKFDGFYWVHEAAGKDFAIIPQVKEYLRKEGMKLYWIPYWKAERADQWKTLGFDYAYQQPNYFFNKEIPYQRLDDACVFGKQYDMGMEMEFDNNVIKPEFRKRFYDYIDSFESNGVWAEGNVAYYEGGGAWLRMSLSNDPEMRKMSTRLSEIIINRQKKADKDYSRQGLK